MYENGRGRIDGTEMDGLRRSAGICKLDRKTNESIGGKMNAQDTILDETVRKQLIWFGHVERMERTELPKLVVNWKHEGRIKRGRPEIWDM